MLPAAAAALNIDSPGLNLPKAKKGTTIQFCEFAVKDWKGKKGEKEKNV